MTELKINTPGQPPSRSELIAWSRFVELACVEPGTVAELMEMGWLDPVCTGANQYLFRPHDVYRIQKLMRLCRDLEIPHAAGSIIVDLLERVERMEQELNELKRLL